MENDMTSQFQTEWHALKTSWAETPAAEKAVISHGFRDDPLDRDPEYGVFVGGVYMSADEYAAELSTECGAEFRAAA